MKRYTIYQLTVTSDSRASCYFRNYEQMDDVIFVSIKYISNMFYFCVEFYMRYSISGH